jgi:DNA-binding response OmpR family regulator
MLIPFPSRHHPLTRLPRILAVSHDPAMVRLLREMFSYHRSAVRIEQASSSAMACERLARLNERPRLVIIAIGLHHQLGLDVLRRARSDHRLACIPTIVLAQCPHLKDERQALAIGADFYFEHPTGIADFSPLVSRCRELLALDDEGDEFDEARTTADAAAAPSSPVDARVS